MIVRKKRNTTKRQILHKRTVPRKKTPVEDEPTKTNYTKSRPFDKVWIVKLDSMMSTRVMWAYNKTSVRRLEFIPKYWATVRMRKMGMG
jgi:hypothetical protein